MRYECKFEVLECSKRRNQWLKAFCGVDGCGEKIIFSYVTSAEPTLEYVQGMTEHLNSYEDGDIVLMGAKFLGFIPMEEEETYETIDKAPR